MVIDGGNSFYKDDIRRGRELAERGIALRRRRHIGRRLGPGARLLPDDRRRRGGGGPARPDLRGAGARAPAISRARRGAKAAIRAPSAATSTAGPAGAGHFVKMVHNGIEYGLMQAYAEGFDILRNASRPEALPEDERFDARPRRHRRGLAARQRRLLLAARPLGRGAGRGHRPVALLGRGAGQRRRALDDRGGHRGGRPSADVLSAALYARFRSRRGAPSATSCCRAMRFKFGGHVETPRPPEHKVGEPKVGG